MAAASLALAVGAGLLLGRPGPRGPRVAREEAPDSAAVRRPVRAPEPTSASPAPPTFEVPGGAAGAARDPGAPACVVGRQILFGGDDPRRAGTPAEIARALLVERRRDLGLDAMPGDLVLAREFDSLSAHHLRMRQTVGGVPVEGSEVSAHVALDGRPLLLVADVFPLDGVADAAPVPAVAADAARRTALDLVGPGFDADDDEPADEPEADESADASRPAPVARDPLLVVLPEGRSGRLAWRVDVGTASESSRVWVDAADGEILSVADLRRTADGTGAVFAPNPVHSQKDATLRDAKDADSAALTSARVPVILRRLDGTGLLRGLWADASSSRGAPSRGDTFDWSDLVRSEDGFEAVNAYHHVDRVQERLQALGFTNVNASRQRVDAHGTTQDQSFYDQGRDEIVLGDGGVDDGEDGDIVVHEVGHAIHDDQVEGFGSTDEGAAMGEGFSDYLAATLHATGDPVWDPLVGSWDATSYSRADPPFLRRVDGEKRYPDDLAGEEHDDGEIWSRFLWDLNALLGADEALRLVVESHFFLSPNARFLQGADAVLVANLSLRGAADDDAIRALLRDRGLPFSQPPVDAPPEDPYEENDVAAGAAPLELGVHSDLLLADDDWYRVTVAPFRRLHARATFDPVDLDLDLEVANDRGVPIDASEGVAGIESVDAAAGLGGATFLVRARRAPGSVAVAGYSLLLAETDLEEISPGRTDVLTVRDRSRAAYTLVVPPEKAGSRIVLRSRAKGRRRAVNDVRVVSPSGDVVVDFGEGRRADGARIVVKDVEPGAWVVELAPRAGTGGRYALRANFKK